MTLDPRAARFLEMVSAGRTQSASRDIIERRVALAKLMTFARADRMSPAGRDIVLPSRAGGIPARLYAPEQASGVLPAVIFFHGGGLVAGSLDSHDVIARALCAESGCRIVAVDYRLAPEHPFPAALDDAAQATAAVAEMAADLAIDPARIAILGESGGGALAVAVAHASAQGEGPRLALLCLICPVLDFGADSESRLRFAQGYLIDRETLQADLADYLTKGLDPADPRVSPLRLPDLSGLPPTIIHTAQYDPLCDEGEAFAKRLTQARAPVIHKSHAGMLHNFHALGAVLPQGRAALTEIGSQIAVALRI